MSGGSLSSTSRPPSSRISIHSARERPTPGIPRSPALRPFVAYRSPLLFNHENLDARPRSLPYGRRAKASEARSLPRTGFLVTLARPVTSMRVRIGRGDEDVAVEFPDRPQIH